MKLYYSRGACSLAPHIIIREINASCELVAVDLATHALKEDGSDFYKINPKGAVPTLELDNGDILTENAVIQQYLADTFKATHLLPAFGNMQRYHILEWLNYVSTEIHKGFSPLFNIKLPTEVKDNIFMPILLKKFAFVNEHLAKQTYLTGEEFTLPDAYMVVMLNWTKSFKMNLGQWPNLARLYQEARKRPAVAKAFEEEGLH